MSLRLKFNLVMLATFVVGLLLAAFFVHRISVETATQSQLEQARVMMGEARATIHYTDSEVAPLLAEQMKVQFLPQAIPFFAAAESFRLLTRDFPDYIFHQATTTPTNPSDLPAPWEAAIIQRFRDDPTLTRLVSQSQVQVGQDGKAHGGVGSAGQGGQVLSYALPIKVTEQSCLSCNSTPEAAPTTQLDVYGSKNGFGWHIGDIVGATIVSVPETHALQRANHLTLVTVGWLVVVFAVMLGLVNLLLNAVIIRPVRHITEIADRVSLGDFTAPEFEVGANDEIGSLATSFNRMRRSLENAMKMLGD